MVIKNYFLKSLFGLSVIVCCSLLAVIFNSVGAISRGYITSDTDLKPGMAAMLDQENSTANSLKVTRANSDHSDKFIGIVADADQSSVTIASASQSVYIQTDGEIETFVSDIDGKIVKGDQLAVSSLKGILAKRTNYSQVIAGVALEDFGSKSSEEHEINTEEGPMNVKVAKIKINLDQKSIVGTNKVDSSLERLGRSISGKEVSEIRVIIALLIFLIVLVAEGGILYGAISSAITSVGRNPLAREIIRKQLIQVVVIAFAVLILGLGAIYMVLWV